MNNMITDRIAEAAGLTPQQVHDCLKAMAMLTADEAQPVPDHVDELDRFWLCFADAVSAGRLVNNEDFRMDGVRLSVIWHKAYMAYQIHYRARYGREGMSQPWIRAKVKKHPSFVTHLSSAWVGRAKTSVLLFDRPSLPVPVPAARNI